MFYLTLVYTFDNTMLSIFQVLCMQCQRASVPFEASSARRSNIVFQAWGRLDVSKYATRIQIHHSGSAELESYQVRLVAASAGHQHIPVPEATPTAKEFRQPRQKYPRYQCEKILTRIKRVRLVKGDSKFHNYSSYRALFN